MARKETLYIDDVRARFPEAYAALEFEGFESREAMHEESDVAFFTVNGELRSYSHDERAAMKYVEGAGWLEIAWEGRFSPAGWTA